jgi:hypothetical protein
MFVASSFDLYLDQVNLNLDTRFETFTLVLLNNILLVQANTCIDLSLVIGNLIDTLLSGFLVVFTLYF